MIRLTNVLAPVDFSPTSAKALNYALSFALQFRARLVLAHIVPSNAALSYSFPLDPDDHRKQAFAAARENLPLQVPA